MSYSATVYKVMIASPGDVAKERQLAREVVQKWNNLHAEQTGIVLLSISWETHSSPEMGDRPQAIINKQILKDADLLIGIFWTKLGTPTGKAESGTVEEIQEHVQAEKPAMIYFSNQPVLPDSIDQEQYTKLKTFKETMQQDGLYHDYDSLSQFQEDLYCHLVRTVNNNEYFAKQGEASIPSFTVATEAVQPLFSREAKLLLCEAVSDKNGFILKTRTMSGTSIQTNNKNLIPEQKPRVVALWEHALDELVAAGFVEEQGHKGESFAVTHLGYQYADKLENDIFGQWAEGDFSEYELAIIKLIGYDGEVEDVRIMKYLAGEKPIHSVDYEAAKASLIKKNIIIQSKNDPVKYKFSTEGAIWASKNKKVWNGSKE